MPTRPPALTFPDRDALVDHVASITPWPPHPAEPFVGGRTAAERPASSNLTLRTVSEPPGRAVTRSHPTSDTASSRWGRPHPRVREHGNPERFEKFTKSCVARLLARIYRAHPERIWNSIEPYKTGWSEAEHASVPPMMSQRQTGGINAFIHTLRETGYLHNHARMYRRRTSCTGDAPPGSRSAMDAQSPAGRRPRQQQPRGSGWPAPSAASRTSSTWPMFEVHGEVRHRPETNDPGRIPRRVVGVPSPTGREAHERTPLSTRMR